MPAQRRPMSASSDEGDIDGYAEKEQEYQRLQRTYRIMENDRRAYCQESQDLIKKKKAEINKLEKEQEEILKNMRLCESRRNRSQEDKQCEELGDLSRKKKDLEKEIEEEKKKQQELDAESREMEKKVGDQQKDQGGTQSSGKHQKDSSKGQRVQENRLDNASKKFNNLCKQNAKLRDEIDSLRRERRRFDELYQKVAKEREQLQLDIGRVIDNSTQAYEQRDDAQAKMILLKEKADKDKQQHDTEMKELMRVLDHDRKLREFMNTKGRERQEDPQLVEWRKKKESIEAEKKKASQTDSVEGYEAAIERMKEITGEDDLNILVNKFIEVEDRNFALFSFVNEQNNQIELLQEQKTDIDKEIENFNAQGTDLEAQRKQILKQLEAKQNIASKRANEADEKHKGVMKIIDQLRAGVDSLFSKINCDSTAIDDMLGGEKGCTDQNMMQYLGLIEERTNVLLLCKYYVDKQSDYEDYLRAKNTLIGEGPQKQRDVNLPHPPAIGDEYMSEPSDVSDDDNRPLTRIELEKRALKSVRKRETAAKKDTEKYDLSGAMEKTKKKEKSKK